VALACPTLACSSNESGTLELVTGQETDTFTQAPVPAKLEVTSIDSSGNQTELATATLPASTMDLGSLDPNSAGIIQVSGVDDAGTRILSGQSIPVLFGWIDGITLPVFIQRTGELARLPDPPTDSRPSPVAGVINGRYVVVTGGADATLASTTMLYDLMELAPVSPAVTLPLTPTSMAFVGTVGWLINTTGVYQYDFSTGIPTSVTLPTGPSLPDIAGGATVSAPDGSQYIVGATRTTGDATAAVLAIDSSGNPAWLTLANARLGAAATWVASVGLVVIGGSATAHGAEVIRVGSASTGAPDASPPDPSVGSGAAALDGSHVLIAGGVLPDGSSAGVRTIDLSCTTQCAPVVWPPLGAPIIGVQAFAGGAGSASEAGSVGSATSAVVVGSEPPTSAAPGLTHVYQVTSSATTEIPTKVAHTNAGALASPIGVVGSVLLVGGAPAIESLGL
jgi:hypothetical protein